MPRESAVADLLRGALDESGLTIDGLIERAAIETSRSSMSRKLRGLQGFEPEEVARIERVLGVHVIWTGKRYRLEKAA